MAGKDRTCPYCGASVGKGDGFCRACWAELPATSASRGARRWPHGGRWIALVAVAAGLVVCVLLSLAGARRYGIFVSRDDARVAGPCAAGSVLAPPRAIGAAHELPDVFQARGDAGRSGRMPGSGPTGEPVLRWCFDAGGEVVGSPVLVGGALFVAANDRATGRGVLLALDPLTGAERWRFEATRWLAAPASDGKSIFVAGIESPPAFDFVPTLYAIDAATGRTHWQAGAPQTTRLAGPVVSDNRLYIGANTWPAPVVAIDAGSGGVKWSVSTYWAGNPAAAGGLSSHG